MVCTGSPLNSLLLLLSSHGPQVEGEGLYIELVRAGRRPVESTSAPAPPPSECWWYGIPSVGGKPPEMSYSDTATAWEARQQVTGQKGNIQAQTSATF